MWAPEYVVSFRQVWRHSVMLFPPPRFCSERLRGWASRVRVRLGRPRWSRTFVPPRQQYFSSAARPSYRAHCSWNWGVKRTGVDSSSPICQEREPLGATMKCTTIRRGNSLHARHVGAYCGFLCGSWCPRNYLEASQARGRTQNQSDQVMLLEGFLPSIVRLLFTASGLARSSAKGPNI